MYNMTLKYGNLLKSTSAFLFCSVTGNIQFQIKWLGSKTRKWHIAVMKTGITKDYQITSQDGTPKDVASNTVTNCLYFQKSTPPGA